MKVLSFVFILLGETARTRRAILHQYVEKSSGTEAEVAAGCCSFFNGTCGNTSDWCNDSPSQCQGCNGTWLDAKPLAMSMDRSDQRRSTGPPKLSVDRSDRRRAHRR